MEELAFHNEYKLGPKLGCGAFSQVRISTRVSLAEQKDPQDCKCDSATKQVQAVKILNLRDKDSDKASSKLRNVAAREVAVLKVIGHQPNCVSMHRHFCGNVFCYVVMEKCEMSLLQALDYMAEFTEFGLGKVVAQMLLGISQAHAVKVIHRDIKPDNFLVVGDGKTVKLADFGLSAILPEGNKVKGTFGTAPYMCPEMISKKPYGTEADMWSFGVIVYVLLFGMFPYTSKEATTKAMKNAILTGNSPSFLPMRPAKSENSPNSHLRSQDAIGLTKALLNRIPEERFSAEEALQAPWIVNSLEGQQEQPDADLPSLRPMLHWAKRIGVFEMRNPATTCADDVLLNQFQLECNDQLSRKPKNASKKESSEYTSNASTQCESSNGVSSSEQDHLVSEGSAPPGKHSVSGTE